MTLPSTSGTAAPVDPGAVNKASHDFDYAGWNVKVELDAARSDGIVSGHADLYQESSFKCRLTLSGRHRDGSSAIQALARKARALIDARKIDEEA